MSTIVRPKESIEGKKVKGHSRDPLLYQGKENSNGIDCYRFIASFDVRSSISQALEAETVKIRPTAHVGLGDELVCARAVILSVKNKYSGSPRSNVSATHGANSWSYPSQTNVQVIRSHEEIQAGMEKRELKAKKRAQISA
jgi:hypothetical protein